MKMKMGDPYFSISFRDDLTVSQVSAMFPEALVEKARSMFGRSLKSAGGCNACEADSNVLTTIGWDLGRFGIQFVASPRHANLLIDLRQHSE